MTSKPDIQKVVVTDLDGTLLNHHDYSWEAALPAIQLLQQQRIPIVFNTSKTYSESIELRKRLNINDPFIVENGSCLYLPKDSYDQPDAETPRRDGYWKIILGQTQEMIHCVMEEVPQHLRAYTRLSLCPPEQAAELTGLSLAEAVNAVQREHSEPLIWDGNAEQLTSFCDYLHSKQLNTLQGGRFLHVIGETDKGIATNKLREFFTHNVHIIALGDSANDAAMLQQADISIMVKSPGNDQLSLLITSDIITENTAPDGWAEAMKTCMQSSELSTGTF